MDTRKINLFVYDTKENFDQSKQFLGEEGSTFKRIISIENINDLDKYFQSENLIDEEYVYLVIHVFATKQVSGIRRFLTSGISDKYPKLGKMYISDGIESEINHLMVDAKISHSAVYKYHEVYSNLKEDKFMVYTKGQVIGSTSPPTSNLKSEYIIPSSRYPRCEYAIITALEEDEMEKVLPMLTMTGRISNKKHLIEYGYLTTNTDKTVAYASQLSTGMIDAAILASELIHLFRPKILIMAGVLGGKPKYINIGDIIVATKIFTIDKGKINDFGFQKEIESSNIDNAYVTNLKRNKGKIIDHINDY